MKRESYQQFAIVASDSAQVLTDKLNEKMIELKDKHPVVTFEGMIARISYEESYTEPESIEDEYRAIGVSIRCQACPYFEPVRKADGTVDERSKWGECPFAHFGRTSKESAACEKLLRMLNDGEVKLCLAD